MNSPERLDLLAFPVDPDLLGTVYHYEFNKKTAHAWGAVLDAYRDGVQRRIPANLPSARLTAALRVASATTVYLGDTSKLEPPGFLMAGARLAAADLHDAAVVWEQQLLGIPREDIRLGYASRFADALAAVKPRAIRVASQIRPRGHQPDIPNHLYRATTWRAAELLAGKPWQIDGKTIHLRTDSDADLLAWDEDQLWTNQYKDRTPVHAALRIGLTLETHRGMRAPVVRLEPVVCRFTPWDTYAKTAWVDIADNKPLLKVELSRARLDIASLETLNILAHLRGEALPIPANCDISKADSPIKAPLPASSKWDIGTGVGMMTIRELAAFAAERFGREPLRASAVTGHLTTPFDRLDDKTGRTEQSALPGGTLMITTEPKPTTDAGKPTRAQRSPIADVTFKPEPLFETLLEAAGCKRIRVHLLYQQPHTRSRMIKLVCLYFGQPDKTAGTVRDDQATELQPGVEIFPEYAGPLLAHGDHDQRPKLVRALRGIDAPAGTRILALCETEFDESAWIKQRKKSRKKGSTETDPFSLDAKPVVNRELAALGIASQSLVTAGVAEPEPLTGDEAPVTPMTALYRDLQRDHPGHLAVADLFRSAGLIPHRLTDALAQGRHGIDHTIAHVGLHVREQRGNSRKKGQPRRLSWTLVALLPAAEQRWNVKAFSPQASPRSGATGWLDYTDALTSIHANPYPEGKRQDTELTASIDIALNQLAQHLEGEGGYVLYVSGEEARGIWPQLANKHADALPEITGEVNGRLRLPGYSPSCQKAPQAIVRVIASGTPRPVRTDRNATTTKIYELDDAKDTWILSNVPRQYSGGSAHSRLGSKKTRWTAEGVEHKKNWYAQTATEISVIEHGGTAAPYAIAAARLCNFQLSWSGRRSYPLPVHLAMQIDKDHPDYRRTVDESEDVDPDDHLDVQDKPD